jgi:uncharacterized protein YjiS (DUF1127 family)
MNRRSLSCNWTREDRRAMRAAPFSQPPSETAPENTGATRVVDRTAQMARACLTPERQFLLRGWRIAATLAMTGEAIARWRRRVRPRDKPTTISDGDVRDIRRTRAEVEAERSKAFWWA